METTAAYRVALAVTLHEAGYRAFVINPAQAHYFAKAQLRRAETDALDVQDLARLAGKPDLTPWTPPPAVYHELRQRLLARAALVAACYNPAIKPLYDRLRAAGGPAKVARYAAARKLLHRSWALVTKRQAFDPQHRQPHPAETPAASDSQCRISGEGGWGP